MDPENRPTHHTTTVTKKILGVILIIIGFAALVTPLTPGSWLIFIGLEFLGWRFLLVDNIKRFFKRNTHQPK